MAHGRPRTEEKVAILSRVWWVRQNGAMDAHIAPNLIEKPLDPLVLEVPCAICFSSLQKATNANTRFGSVPVLAQAFLKKNSNPNRKFKDSKLFYNQAYQKNYESEPQICGPEKTNTQPIQKLKQSRSEKIQIRTENLSGSQKMKMGPKRKHMDPDHEFNYPKNFETDSN